MDQQKNDIAVGTETLAKSRAQLSVWMCQEHNRVSRMLGKPEFPCVLEKLDERWRTGGAHCHSGLADDHEES